MSNATTSTSAVAASPTVAAQGGIFDHVNPSHYNPKDPLVLFIIQAGIIIIFCRLLHYPLSLIKQPRVIAEVIGGILLGPSVLGRIPGFTSSIFPTASMPVLSNVANLGLILFLFLVGLEVDVRVVAKHWRIATAVGIGSMAFPFALGCAIAYGLYRDFPGDVRIGFGVFLLFVGVAMAITAFPVLCRILTALNLLNTPVGVIVLSAGVGNDVAGWILLALCVALVNAGTGLTALWVLLTCVGFVIFIVFAVRPAFMWILHRTKTFENGPSQSIVALTLLMVLLAAFFTASIGIHAVFGAFIIGVICPHEGGFALKLTEKIEDLVGALLLPLYFALSGLNTNLGLLNSGKVWGYVIAIMACAFFGKFLGAGVAARASGLVWRESFGIGALMSCKGLVELIVLNIGLQARILSDQTFTMFVVMALVTTFATTPLVQLIYPPWYQRKLDAWKKGEIDWNTGRPIKSERGSISTASIHGQRVANSSIQNLLVNLTVESIPSSLAFLSILKPSKPQKELVSHPFNQTNIPENEDAPKPEKRISAHGVHLIGLTQRSSSVMKVSEIMETGLNDPVVNTFQTFGQLYNLNVSGEAEVVPEEDFSSTLVQKATDYGIDFLFLPWVDQSFTSLDQTNAANVEDSYHAHFILKTLRKSPSNAGVFVDLSAHSYKVNENNNRLLVRTKSAQSLRIHGRQPPKPRGTLVTGARHIHTALFGGADDSVALAITLQLVEKGCTATIVRYDLGSSRNASDVNIAPPSAPALTLKSPVTSSQPAPEPTQTSSPTNSQAPHPPPLRRLNTDTFTLPGHREEPVHISEDEEIFAHLRSSLPSHILERIVFDKASAAATTSEKPAPLQDGTTAATPADLDIASLCAANIQQEMANLPAGIGGLVLVGRNWSVRGLEGRREGGSGHALAEKCLGVVATAVLRAGVKGGMLVVKSAGSDS